MLANPDIPLTIDYIHSAPVDHLVKSVKEWLVSANPTCLRHPHGFFVVPLEKTQLGDWRFHLWPNGSRKVIGMPAFIHTHDRHVESRILCGELTNIVYEVDPLAEGGQPLYAVGYGGDRYVRSTSNTLSKTAERGVPRCVSSQRLSAGDCYRVEHHAFHEAVVPEHVSTATIVWMHSRTPGPVYVVGRDGYPEHIEFTRAEISGIELAHLIDKSPGDK